jgi:hypothetical protein
MNGRYLLVLAAILASGCVSMEKGVFLNKGTQVRIVDVSKDTIFSGFSQADYKPLASRLIANTKTELESRRVQTTAEGTSGAAILKYDIRTVSGPLRLSLTYKITLETPDGKIVFTDDDEKHDTDIDNLLDSIASRAARAVSRAFTK